MSHKTRVEFDCPVILVGGGDVDWKQFEYAAGLGAPVVAVDSGADTLRDAGICPDVIIGDMDSISDTRGWPASTKIFKIREQDSTDFEKALYATTASLYLAFGFMGQRLDHSLAALHCLVKYRSRKSVVLIDCVDLMFIPTIPLVIDLSPGTRFSINPIAPVSFLGSKGLQYPLDGLTLETGIAIGTSNTVTESRVSVTPVNAEAGDYMVVVPNANLPYVIEWHTQQPSTSR